MSDEAKKVEVEVVRPITLEESFDIVLNKLKRLEKDMVDSDREVYRAVGEFTDSAVTFAQNMIDVALSPEESNAEAVSDTLYDKKLYKRFEVLRNEADLLLLTAYSNEEIDRILKLEQLLDRIMSRIKSFVSTEARKTQEINLEDLSMPQLRAMAKERQLKGYTKLKKYELVALLSQ